MYTLLGAFACLIILAIIRAFVSPLSKVPGPLVSRFTSLVLKYHELNGNRRLYVHGLHQKYGATVRLSPSEVAFANGEAMKEIYMSGGSGYDKTEFYDLFRQYGTKTAFSTLPKGEHSQRKRLYADRYAMTNVLRPEIVTSIETCSQSVVKKCGGAAGKSVDVYEVLHCYALDCASHFLFGRHGTDSLNSESDLEYMKELSYDNSLQRRMLHYYNPWVSTLMESFAPVKKSRNVSRSSQYVLDKTVDLDPSKHTLMEKLRSQKAVLQDIEMSAECMDHMAAGIDTTGDGLCFLMWFISLPQNLSIQQRLHEELSSNTSNRLEDLPYLDAVIKEGLRCFPPIPMSLPRYAPAGGRTINGYFIPAKTIVSCQPWSVNRLDEAVFPDPDAFNPERWLEEKGFHDRNRLFFSFASGGRGCIGKK